MKKFSVILLALVLGVAVLSGCGARDALDQAQKDGKLIMLTNAGFPPFEYLGDDNKPAGVDVDIANEIAKDLGLSLEVVDMDFGGIVAAVASGKGSFGAAGMTVTDERKKSIDFTIQYAKSAQYIIVAQGDESIKTVADLGGKTVGVQEGTTGDFFVTDEDGDENLPTPAKEIKRYKTALEASMDLANGRLDCVVIDELTAKAIADTNSKLMVVDYKLTEEDYAIAVAKSSPKMLAAINKTLERLIAEGKISELIVQHSMGY